MAFACDSVLPVPVTANTWRSLPTLARLCPLFPGWRDCVNSTMRTHIALVCSRAPNFDEGGAGEKPVVDGLRSVAGDRFLEEFKAVNARQFAPVRHCEDRAHI